MAPSWLTTVAWIYIALCLACAAAIAYDIGVNRRHQPMGVMNAVFPITALYLGPFALALYWRYARAEPAPSRAPMAAMPEMAMAPAGGAAAASGSGAAHAPTARTRPWWATMAIEVSHCGSGCTLGDLIAEWVVYALALTIAGYTLFAEYALDYVFAVALGIVFQYFAIATPPRGRPTCGWSGAASRCRCSSVAALIDRFIAG